MCSPSIRGMHHTQREREYLSRLRTDILTERLVRAEVRRLGDELYQLTADDADWERFWSTIAEDASNQDIHEALTREIERRTHPQTEGEEYQSWIEAMSDVDRLADHCSPDTAAAMKIEEAAHQVYLKSLASPEAFTQNTPK